MGSRRVLGRMPTRSRPSSTRAGSPRSRVSAPTRRAAGSGGSTRASSGDCRCRPRTRRRGGRWRTRDDAIWPTTTRSRTCISSMPRTAVHWTHQPRILSEHLAPLPEPLACLLTPTAIEETSPAAVAALGARALLDWPPQPAASRPTWPRWLAPHQVPAAERLAGILTRYNGALLADAVGLGKSYVALAVALAFGEPFALVVPAVLVHQWRALLAQRGVAAPVITHEGMSVRTVRQSVSPSVRLFIVDEAHRFRNPDTNRYRALAKRVVGARLLLVTATPIHNRIADLCHLFRLFLRDHDLTALGVSSLRLAARAALDAETLGAVAARLIVARSRSRVQAAYAEGPLALTFPARAAGEIVRAGPLPDDVLGRVIAGVQ